MKFDDLNAFEEWVEKPRTMQIPSHHLTHKKALLCLLYDPYFEGQTILEFDFQES